MESPNISTPPQTDTPSKPEAISSIPSQTPKFSPRLIATFVLLLVIVGAFGFFLGKSLSQPKTSSPTSISQTSPTPTPTKPTPIPTIDPTANWKIYRNEKHKYSVKYPQHWFIREIDRAKDGVNRIDVIISSYNELDKPWPPSRAKIEAWVSENPQRLDGEKWYRELRKNAQDYTPIISEEKVILGGTEGFKSVSEHPDDPNGSIYMINLPQENKMYEFWVGGNKEYLSTLDLILSTFKFLD